MTDIAVATEIPAGYSFDIDFRLFQSRITFVSPTELIFAILTGSQAGLSRTVDYRSVTLRPGLFAVSWQEPDHTTVVHLEDFAEGLVHASITQPDGTFLRLSGTILR